MDSAGKNRYELLFMDDDVSDPLDNLVAPTTAAAAAAAAAGKKKQPSAAAAATKTTAKVNNNNNKAAAGSNGGPNAKKPNQAEKENKPNNALNKTDGKKFAPSADKQFNNNNNKQGAPRPGGGANRTREFGSGQGQGAQGQGQGQQRSVNFRQQNGNGNNAETREQRNNRRNVRENGGAPDGQQSRPYRGPGGGQGGAGGDRPPRRNYDGQNRKREFDRQSGSDRTGVKSIDKRDGAGSHNWGSVKEAIDDVNKNESETNVANAEGGAKADESGAEPQTEQQAAAEEEAKELTLDEWKAQQGQRIKPTFNIRKAGEGEDTTQWKKMVVLTSNKKKENDSEEELEYDPALYPQRVGRQQRVLDIQFNFNDGRRGGPGGFGGRGGRGGPRPGGFGGGPRSEGGNREGGNREGGGNQREGGNRGPRDGQSGQQQHHNNEGGAPSAQNQRPPIERRGPGNNQNNNQNNSGPGPNKRFERQQNTAPKVNDERQFPTLA